jgi:hypothetical protein
MALQRTRRPRGPKLRSGLGTGRSVQEHAGTGRSLRSLGSPLNARLLGAGRSLRGVIVLVAAALVASGCHTGPTFEEYRSLVANSAGADALDCGVVALGSSRAEAVSCVQSALSNRRPVRVILQVQGIDSDIWLGLAVDEAGRGTRLMWDSDAFGGGSRFRSKAWIDRADCGQPSVTESDPPIHCSPVAGA